MFDVIDQLKSEWTDKYVVVNSRAPELARFASTTGQVKTVNMNGQCLVEFDQYNNIGWYDIDPSALKIVPKPEPKPKDSKPAKKPTAQKKVSSQKKPQSSGRPSTADILAAARGKKSAKPSGRPSTSEILAAARQESSVSQDSPPPPKEEPIEQPKASSPSVEEAKVTEINSNEALPTTTAEKITWCRSHDGNA